MPGLHIVVGHSSGMVVKRGSTVLPSTHLSAHSHTHNIPTHPHTHTHTHTHSLTVSQVNQYLNDLAMSNAKKERAGVKKALQLLLRNTSAMEQKWLIRMILKVQ